MKKPLSQLMKEAGLEWPKGAKYAAQDKRDYKVIFYAKKPGKPEKEGDVWFFHIDDYSAVYVSEPLQELCKKWRKTLITKEEYLGAD